MGPCRKVRVARRSGSRGFILASDLSAFVTGHNIPVDGGSHAGGGWFFSPDAKRFVNRPKGL